MREHAIGDIESLTTIVNLVRRVETVIQEKLLGRVRGMEIRFRGQTASLLVMRSDPAMTNAKELIEAIVYRMRQVGELDYEIVDFAGKPLLRQIAWKGQLQPPRRKSGANVMLGSLIGLALLFGSLLAFMGTQEMELRKLASVPPHEIALSAIDCRRARREPTRDRGKPSTGRLRDRERKRRIQGRLDRPLSRRAAPTR